MAVEKKNRQDQRVLLDVRDLKIYFETEDGTVKAADGVSFRIDKGETLGLVGESGCGKTVTSLGILRLISPPGKIVSGEIFFNGRDLLKLSEEAIRQIRGNAISMVFQEPMTSLNPVFRVGDQIGEVLRIHRKASRKEAIEAAVRLLDEVEIPDARRRARDYPHQMSGGMRQRVMIAMAIACRPALVIADEPTTALDVTIQAQILEILRQLRSDYNLSVLLITHNLGVIAEFADRVAVMYAGRIVEEAETRDLYKSPKHPYTVGLLRSLPDISAGSAPERAGKKRLETIEGSVPDLIHMPPGCSFAPRCPSVMPRCSERFPETFPVGERHYARCFLYDDLHG
jgi:oligopeptide/dipeptide ABC transporter ATP-binding protein